MAIENQRPRKNIQGPKDRSRVILPLSTKLVEGLQRRMRRFKELEKIEKSNWKREVKKKYLRFSLLIAIATDQFVDIHWETPGSWL